MGFDGVLNDMVGGIVVAVLSVGASGLFRTFRTRRRYGHVRAFVGPSPFASVRIILPGTDDAITSSGSKNAVAMTLPEGSAISRITSTIRRVAPRGNILLQDPDWFADGEGAHAFITVGRPSVNRITRQLLERFYPELVIDEETGKARINDITYEARWQNGEVITDFGFILFGHSARHTRYMAIFGITPFGANIAARAFDDLKNLTRDHRRFTSGRRVLVIVKGAVDGYGLAGKRNQDTVQFERMDDLGALPEPDGRPVRSGDR